VNGDHGTAGLIAIKHVVVGKDIEAGVSVATGIQVYSLV
jgi:hypothetical protein